MDTPEQIIEDLKDQTDEVVDQSVPVAKKKPKKKINIWQHLM